MQAIFQSILTLNITFGSFIVCLITSLVIGFAVAFTYMKTSKRYTNSFVVTLALLPAVVQIVIMMVNGNLGAGVAVAGAFSLVRFRSIPGTAKEIGFIFIALASGLATGMGFIWVAAVFTAIMVIFTLFYTLIGFGKAKSADRELKITIPENIDYTNLFDDLMKKIASVSHVFGKEI